MCRNAIKCSPARFYSMNFGVPKDIQQPNNFNMIRLFLAFYVFCVHFVAISGIDTNLTILRTADCVRGFFVISGFLIYASYCRSTSLKSYFVKRARRIFPSYFFIVIFFSIVLFFVSSVSFSEYFGQDWVRYLAYNLSFSNFAQPTLPGVFTENNIVAVNGSLWTIKIELMCYVALPILVYICKKIKINPIIFFVLLILLSVVYTVVCNTLFGRTGDERFVIYARQIGGQLAYFVMGMLMYELLHLIVRHRYKLIIVGGVALMIAYLIPECESFVKPMAIPMIVIPAAFIGRWGFWIGSTDISYDLYLLHFPVVQIFAHYNTVKHIGAVPAFIIVSVTVIVLSAMSWHFWGRRFLRRRKAVPAVSA